MSEILSKHKAVITCLERPSHAGSSAVPPNRRVTRSRCPAEPGRARGPDPPALTSGRPAAGLPRSLPRQRPAGPGAASRAGGARPPHPGGSWEGRRSALPSVAHGRRSVPRPRRAAAGPPPAALAAPAARPQPARRRGPGPGAGAGPAAGCGPAPRLAPPVQPGRPGRGLRWRRGGNRGDPAGRTGPGVGGGTAGPGRAPWGRAVPRGAGGHERAGPGCRPPAGSGGRSPRHVPGPAAPAAQAGPAGTRNAARLPWDPPLPLVRVLSSVPGDGRAVAGRSPPRAGTRAAQGRKRRLPHQGARIPLLLHRGRCAYLL